MKRTTLSTNRNEVFKQRPAAASNGIDLDLVRGRCLMAARACVCVCLMYFDISKMIKFIVNNFGRQKQMLGAIFTEKYVFWLL